MADMDMYALVLKNALAQGKHVAPGVHLYLQFGSQKIKQYARAKGYIETRKLDGWLKSAVFGTSFKLTRGKDRSGNPTFNLAIK